jgi:hypothetical protein
MCEGCDETFAPCSCCVIGGLLLHSAALLVVVLQSGVNHTLGRTSSGALHSVCATQLRCLRLRQVHGKGVAAAWVHDSSALTRHVSQPWSGGLANWHPGVGLVQSM